MGPSPKPTEKKNLDLTKGKNLPNEKRKLSNQTPQALDGRGLVFCEPAGVSHGNNELKGAKIGVEHLITVRVDKNPTVFLDEKKS